MACNKCGEPCQGRYCSFCESAEARDDGWEIEPLEEDDEA